MARPPSSRILHIESELRNRLTLSSHTPGARFYSNRALAQAYGISQQTAHTILDRLCREGLLARKPASGTFVPGVPPVSLRDVVLVFNRRAQRRDSFGHQLLSLLANALERENISYSIQFTDTIETYSRYHSSFPVFWEVDESRLRSWEPGRFGLILHREPPLGLAASWLDSILVDDRSGGVMAGEILRDSFSPDPGSTLMVAGPPHDPRSRNRIEGFKAVFPKTRILFACGWFRDHGREIAPDVFRKKPKGIFCCNDRLAEGLIQYGRDKGESLPAILGFDDAPVAETLGFNTIAIPWEEMVENAVQLIRKRLDGDRQISSQRILTPRPVIRTRLHYPAE